MKWYSSFGLITLLLANSAFSATVSFSCITGNSIGDCTIGEAQLSANIVDLGSQVQFNLFNSGADAAVVSEVYFDGGSQLGFVSLIDSDDGIGGDAGVDFSQGANPPNLPGGNNATPPFQTTISFDADSPPPARGIGPGEWLGILFDLPGTQNFNDIIAELTDGSLRIGVHVIAFDSGGSESFVNNPVPLPATLWLFGSGLLGLFAFRKKLNRR